MLEHLAGGFFVLSDKIHASDPCYQHDTWCAGSFPAKNGAWVATYEKLPHEKTGWGERISRLRIHNVEFALEHFLFTDKWTPDTKLNIDLGVDSGQAGFFDHDAYNKYGGDNRSKENDYKWDDNSFYGRACLLTQRKERIPLEEQEKDPVFGFPVGPFERSFPSAGILQIPEIPVPIGVVSSSGFGDGGYDLYVKNDENGMAIAAEIVFISEEELEDADTDD